ncbi:MAG: preprotein translocase subunit SecG [Alphaproteobacteria bacterium]
MILFILIVHVIIAVALVVMVLLQRSEGGALGMGGGNTTGGLMTGRAAGNLLTRSTGILGAAFMITSIGLAILTGVTSSNRSLFDNPPLVAPAPVQQEQSDEPAQPTVPLSR